MPGSDVTCAYVRFRRMAKVKLLFMYLVDPISLKETIFQVYEHDARTF